MFEEPGPSRRMQILGGSCIMDYNTLTILQNDIILTLLRKIAEDNQIPFSWDSAFENKYIEAKQQAEKWLQERS
jgi:hypothetical protein